MRNIIATITLAVSAMILTLTSSCNEDSTIGTSIIQEQVEVIIDSTYTITGQTIHINAIPSKTVAQLIGRIDADGFGHLSSDVVTQFMPAISLDTVGITVADIDSIALVMQFAPGEFVGDSIAPLGIEVYPLTKQLPSPIYSDFDPKGYYDPTQKLGSTIYNVTAFNAPDTIRTLSYRQIRVKLPLELGRRLYQAYLDDPATFASPTQFSQKIFPGIYIRNSYGSGRLTRVATSMIKMHYHRTYHNQETGTDSIVRKTGNYFAVTPEIITNNNITLTLSPAIDALISQGKNIILAPTGLEVQMRFPLPELIATLRDNKGGINVINSLTLAIPAQTIQNNSNITLPRYLLMVLKKDRDTFFNNNNLPDSKTSFYAEYNTVTGTYNFTSMRQYLTDMMAKSDITPDDYTFDLVPVSATYESMNTGSYYYGGGATSILSSILPYSATPVMGILDLDNAKIKLTYSRQTINK